MFTPPHIFNFPQFRTTTRFSSYITVIPTRSQKEERREAWKCWESAEMRGITEDGEEKEKKWKVGDIGVFWGESAPNVSPLRLPRGNRGESGIWGSNPCGVWDCDCGEVWGWNPDVMRARSP